MVSAFSSNISCFAIYITVNSDNVYNSNTDMINGLTDLPFICTTRVRSKRSSSYGLFVHHIYQGLPERRSKRLRSSCYSNMILRKFEWHQEVKLSVTILLEIFMFKAVMVWKYGLWNGSVFFFFFFFFFFKVAECILKIHSNLLVCITCQFESSKNGKCIFKYTTPGYP